MSFHLAGQQALLWSTPPDRLFLFQSVPTWWTIRQFPCIPILEIRTDSLPTIEWMLPSPGKMQIRAGNGGEVGILGFIIFMEGKILL
ncbi:hypothetical protein, partial [Christiangramia aquimixticola]|uniref:hypothetical protein n=1 Tax=Christiangramia aquimixticola TaxID=1697558 RepID=UPI003AA7BB1F